jgi:hypothetical protein
MIEEPDPGNIHNNLIHFAEFSIFRVDFGGYKTDDVATSIRVGPLLQQGRGISYRNKEYFDRFCDVRWVHERWQSGRIQRLEVQLTQRFRASDVAMGGAFMELLRSESRNETI